MTINLEDIYGKIEIARDRIKDNIHETPIDYSHTLSRMTDSKFFLKLENLQKTGSFKVRGALNKLMSLSEEKVKKGVIAASAGNHAQGVAYAASIVKTKSIIVMPENAPYAKIMATKGYGAEVILYGKNINESLEKALEISRSKNLTFIHPYDDLEVICGQGTIGLELIGISPEVVIIPIGGGGLISGISIALRKRYGSKIKIIGVQSSASPSMKKSIEVGRPISVEVTNTIADGILVKSVSELTFKIVSELVDDIVLVDDDQIATSMFLLMERAKTVAEGAGAASVAAALSGQINLSSKRVVALVSGGNVDLSLLAKILYREEVKQGRIIKLKVNVPDVPGSLNRVIEKIVSVRGNIIEIYHDRWDPSLRPAYTWIYILMELPSKDEVNKLMEELNKINVYAHIEVPTNA